MVKKKVYIFRHGVTDWNKLGRMQGHTDIPLNEMGVQQASGLHPFFQSNPVERVISSDLQRAIDTASLATGHSNDLIYRYPVLREINLGLAEGKTSEEIINTWGYETWDQWREGSEHFGFLGGETKAQAQNRIHSGIVQVLKEHSIDNIAICTHGFVLRLFLNKIGFSIDSIPNCGLFTISYFKGHQNQKSQNQNGEDQDSEFFFEVTPNFEIK